MPTGSISAMTTDTAIIPDNYDTPWKEAIEHHFPEFMAFYFPQATKFGLHDLFVHGRARG